MSILVGILLAILAVIVVVIAIAFLVVISFWFHVDEDEEQIE